jgi:integrase/recombinase XerC
VTDLATIPDLGQLANRDLLIMAFAGLKPQTMKLYKGDWRRFLTWAQLNMREFFELEKAEAAVTLNHYLAHLADIGRKPATRARAKQAICSVVDRLYAADALPWTLAKLKIIETPKVRAYKDVEGLAHEAWLKLLSTAESDGSPRGVRDVAILLLLHDSALRRREVSTLRLGDYEAGRARVHVWGKGRDVTERDAVPLSDRCADALDAWLEHRDDSKALLFTPFDDASRKHPEFYDEDVNYAVRYWCRQAEIPEVGPHQLRHAAITQAARRGASPIALQSFARHESFDITKRYIHTAREDARSVAVMLGEETEDDEDC